MMASVDDRRLNEMTTLLSRAIEANDVSSVESIIKLLKALYPNVNLDETLPGFSMPVLHLAVGFSKNETQIVDILLEEGCDPNSVALEEKISPLHLSVIYDYDKVLKCLVQFGGIPKNLTGDGKNCYDLAKDNLEERLNENCFTYFYKKSSEFRTSIKPTDKVALAWKDSHGQTLSCINESSESGTTSCESFENVSPSRLGINEVTFQEFIDSPATPKVDSLCAAMGDLMTDDESGFDGKFGRLSTIQEESGISGSSQNKRSYGDNKREISITSSAEYSETESVNSKQSSGSATVLTDVTSEPSCANSTPPVLPTPTKQDIVKLQNIANPLNLPVTKTTFGVIKKIANEDNGLQQVLSPKPGTVQFSTELKAGLKNFHLIDEWGNLKIEFLQSMASTPSGKFSKSFYNYLLLDPRIIKRVNFSGSYLKSAIIKNAEKFETFLKAVFYIGKGCGKRPIQHLVDAKSRYQPGKRLCNGEKLDKITEIWKSGLGVQVVSVFYYSSEKEANVNEAAMIDAIGVSQLSNINKGSYGGTVASSWPQKTKNQFGSFLLYKSFCAFAVGEHKTFFPHDI